MKRILSLCLTLCLILGFAPVSARAELSWPDQISIQADAGFLMDADTGAVLYEKNADQPYYPASITKILTALIVLEHCSLDETVVFSHDAVYNVESGSSNAGLDEGDTLTVRDCLYALLLASANESANALAEHVSGSREAFAQLMNEKAQSLGCTGSHFANPSGLNDENHYTTARDMALIAQAAIANPVFVEICGTYSYRLPPTKRYPASEFPNGRLITNHHRMCNPYDSLYYKGAFCGKTGYTSLAGNTLVTCARQENMTLIAVILNGHLTHYEDTRTLFDFGFNFFQSLSLSDYETAYSSIPNELTVGGMTSYDEISVSLAPSSRITLPKSASFQEVSAVLNYDLDSQAPSQALAQIEYSFMDHPVGQAYLCLTSPEEEEQASLQAAPEVPETSETSQSPRRRISIHIPVRILLPAGITLLLAALLFLAVYLSRRNKRRDESERLRRHQRRLERLEDIGYSSSQFDRIMDQYRSSTTSSYSFHSQPKKKHRKIRRHKRRNSR